MGFNERIIDGDNVDIVVLNCVSEDDTTNAAETIDSHFDRGHDCYGAVSSWRRDLWSSR